MKNIILDTDIGIDCDDAAALAFLFKVHKDKKCKILGVSASSAREGASASIRGFLDHFGLFDVPSSKMEHEPLSCDKKNVYAAALKEKFKSKDAEEGAVKMIRRLLSKAEDKVTLCSIGPLSNIADLLLSEGDEYSSLKGDELVKEKVSEYYLMGGAFEENMSSYSSDGEIMTEWNIAQDISSARIVAEKCPVPMYYCPFEIGSRIKTYLKNEEGPVWDAMRLFAIDSGKNTENFSRSSWDPVTCMWAIGGFEDIIKFSEAGFISINEKGRTIYEKNKNGRHYYMLTNDSELFAIEKKLNDIL